MAPHGRSRGILLGVDLNTFDKAPLLKMISMCVSTSRINLMALNLCFIVYMVQHNNITNKLF
jgi:hypothetical protein